MANDGSTLEEFVAFVEQQFLPDGLSVRTRERVYEDGVIVAELDVVVSGKVGTTDFSWLIECRDRPSEGPAPAAWIEQLHGRGQRFNFNKVTAVSTAGFSQGARSYAAKVGIEVREVANLAVDAFKNWIAATHMTHLVRNCDLTRVTLNFSEADVSAHGKELTRILTEATEAKVGVLRRSTTGEPVEAAKAFRAALEDQEKLWDQVAIDGPPKTVFARVNYTNADDHFVVDVNGTPVRVWGVHYRGVLTRTKLAAPISKASEYRDANNRTISQYVAYEPMKLNGLKFGLEFHCMPDIEEAFIILKTSKDDD